MNKIVSIQGPVEKIDGKFILLIPLAAGGSDLVTCSRGIGTVEGENLKVTIPDWMADKMGFSEGTLVNVDNQDGKFNIVLV